MPETVILTYYDMFLPFEDYVVARGHVNLTHHLPTRRNVINYHLKGLGKHLTHYSPRQIGHFKRIAIKTYLEVSEKF